MKNKSDEICDHIIDHGLDLIALTETWLTTDRIGDRELCPKGYDLIHTPRPSGRGGGVGLLIRSNVKHRQVLPPDKYVSFEHQEVVIQLQGYTLTLVIVYRPPPNPKNNFTVPLFLNEFSKLLEAKSASCSKLLVVGDFNFHIDDSSDTDARNFLDILKTFGLSQNVSEVTHQKGHILDLIITRPDDDLISNVSVQDKGISDHFWVECTLNSPKPKTMKKVITYRKIKTIDIKSFESDISASQLGNPSSFDSVEEAVSTYNKVLSQTLDKHAPAVTKTITVHPDTPWYNSEIDSAKKARRKAEKTWRKSKLTIHRSIFMEKREEVNMLIKAAKQNHYSNMINGSHDTKKMFKIVDELTSNKSENQLPEHSSPKELANRFSKFFEDKITKIRTRLDEMQCSPESSPPEPPPMTVWNEFTPATSEEVRKIVMNSKATTCQLDPAPSSLIKSMIDVILPVLTVITNLSFKEGYFPDDLKLALILPLLKKFGLDPEILKHFRPVSNLPYLSKLIERVAAVRLVDHMSLNHLHELYQSSYKKFHSTETALLKIQSDILDSLDKGKCVLLILLDLSAAFDTIDHNVLLTRLQDLGIGGKVYDWFKSYIIGRKQAVLIDGVRSTLWDLLFGVPQGSVLGPILFLIYMGPLGKLLQSLGINYHFYADDSQIYITFDVKDSNAAVAKVEDIVLAIKKWMSDNFLCLNEDKTEVLLIASKCNHTKLDIPEVKIGENNIKPALQAKNIGFIFDSVMNAKAQVNQMCKSGWFYLRKIGKIRPYLDTKSTEILVHCFITSRIDLNNCLLLGLPKTLLHKLQLLQNTAARMIRKVRKFDHITSTLIDLHWLPIPQRIEYKTLLTVFKALNGLAPQYITNLLERKHDIRDLRNNDLGFLITKIPKSATYGDRSFSNVAPLLWNELPESLRLCKDLKCFKRHLKTLLFSQAYFD